MLASKLEKDLYPVISELLRRRGLDVWEEATIRAGDSGTRTADHVAWRWEGSEVEAWAVEAKPGAADVGLAQAVAYSVGFDRVCVAAEEPLSEVGYLSRVFDRLGLGYVRVDREGYVAVLERDPAQSEFVASSIRDENVGRIRMKHLFTNDIVGEEVTFGKDRRGDIWAVTGGTDKWQICVSVVSGSCCAWLSLLAESKWLGDRIGKLDRADALAAAIEQLALVSPVLLVRERRHDGFKPTYSDVLYEWRPDDGVPALASILGSSASLIGTRVGPHFEVRTDLFSHSARMTEGEARRQLQDATARLRSVRGELDRITFG